MEEKVKNIICKYLKPHDKLVVAVSGGVDSVVLLHLLSKYVTNLVIAHINHGIRKESDKEEVFVQKLAEKYSLPIYVKRLYLVKKTEEEARKKRYQYLRQIKEKTGAKYIVCAHHLNDQVETILLNLVRGTGPLDLWGMKVLENSILRPLLCVTKEEIFTYAKKEKLEYVTDKTNSDVKYSRNRIRNEVVPVLTKINPNLLKTINGEAILGEELSLAVEFYVQKAEKEVKKDKAIITSRLLKYPLFIQKEIIRRMVHDMTGKKEGIYSKNISEILKLTQGSGSKKTQVSGFTIVRVYDKIVFDQRPEKIQKRAKIELGEKIEFNGFFIAAIIGNLKTGKSNISLPKEMKQKLNVRTWKAGDKIKTKIGTKKLQDIFTDAKISPIDRKKWPIIVANKEIVWVPFLAASDKVYKGKGKALTLRIKR